MNMNLPNKLTIVRVSLIPFFVFFMLTDLVGAAGKFVALAIFVIASLTDLLDGQIARKYIWSQILGSLWIRWRINFWFVRP